MVIVCVAVIGAQVGSSPFHVKSHVMHQLHVQGACALIVIMILSAPGGDDLPLSLCCYGAVRPQGYKANL